LLPSLYYSKPIGQHAKPQRSTECDPGCDTCAPMHEHSLRRPLHQHRYTVHTHTYRSAQVGLHLAVTANAHRKLYAEPLSSLHTHTHNCGAPWCQLGSSCLINPAQRECSVHRQNGKMHTRPSVHTKHTVPQELVTHGSGSSGGGGGNSSRAALAPSLPPPHCTLDGGGGHSSHAIGCSVAGAAARCTEHSDLDRRAGVVLVIVAEPALHTVCGECTCTAEQSRDARVRACGE
jgi:hypothetical protein